MRVCLLFIFLFLLTAVKCQQSFIKPAALSVHFFLTDFNTPVRIKDKGIGQLFNPELKAMKQGLAFSYLKGVTNHIDVTVTASGSFVDYPVENLPLSGKNSLWIQITTMANLKLLTDKNFFTPYITAGAGISKYKSYYGLFIPAGLGLQFNFKNEIYILLQSHYSFAVADKVSDNLYHSIGIAGNINRKKQVKHNSLPNLQPVIVKTEQDSDADGVMDSNDKCPDKPGTSALQGCPDSDGDGFADDDDKCPTVFGIEKYQGCPIPDSDGDGVNDETDSCISIPGVANNHGCPIIDTTVEQKINSAAEQIFFATGKATLLPVSYKPLNEIAQLLKDNPNYKVSIEGHTDNTGNSKANQLLSEKRANTVLQYLINRGITQARMQGNGFGQDKPVADNNTKEGRSKNRRVEIKVKS